SPQHGAAREHGLQAVDTPGSPSPHPAGARLPSAASGRRGRRRPSMERSEVTIPSCEGGGFDGYLAVPATARTAPAVVLASTVTGVDADLRAIADEIASSRYTVVAPDLFWRTIPGPLPREDNRTMERAEPRLEGIRTGETDLIDVLAH